VEAWESEGLSPVFLGDVSTLVVFLPSDKVNADGQPIATAGDGGDSGEG